MKSRLNIWILSLILVSACSTPTDSKDPLEFDQMEIHYSKMGGWINYFEIDITGTGWMKFTELSHSSYDTIMTNSGYLNQKEKEKLSGWFALFGNFKKDYHPEPWYTDGAYHTVVLKYQRQTDTVAVYEPQNCELPGDLKKIIDFFEAKITFFTSIPVDRKINGFKMFGESGLQVITL